MNLEFKPKIFWDEFIRILYLENYYTPTRFDCNGSSTPG